MSMAAVSIVAVSTERWRDLRAVRLAALQESPGAFAVDYATAAGYCENEWRRRASGENGSAFFIAYDGNESAGLIGGVLTGGEYELVSLWVAPAWRGRGVSDELVSTLQQYAVQAGYREVVLRVAVGNANARRLYQRCGCRPVEQAEQSRKRQHDVLQKMVWPGPLVE